MLLEFYSSDSAPHEALGRYARRLSSGGALYLGGGVGVEKLRAKDGSESFSVGQVGKKAQAFPGPLSATIRGFALAGASQDNASPGGAVQVADPAVAARLSELAEAERERRQDIARFERRLAAKPASPLPSYSPVASSDDAWESRRIAELKVELRQIAEERVRLLAGGGLSEVEQARPGTNFTKIPAANVARLRPIIDHYKGMAHPFTTCVRDQVKHGLSEDHAKRRCAVVKDLGQGTTKWRKGGGKVSEQAELLLAEAAGRVEQVERVLGLGLSVAMAEGSVAWARQVVREPLASVLVEGMANDYGLLALAGHPLAGELFGVVEREFATDKRRELAKKGHAMKDGSFPIETKQDLSNAMRAIGRAPEGKRAAVKAHIRKRAKALGVSLSEAMLGESFGDAAPLPAGGHSAGPRQAGAQRPAGGGSGRYDESKHKRASKGATGGGRFISTGSASNVEARTVQHRLGVATDGNFGPKTAAAVREFQRAHGLQVDGVVGRQTLAALAGKKNAKDIAPGALSSADRSELTRIRRSQVRRRARPRAKA